MSATNGIASNKGFGNFFPDELVDFFVIAHQAALQSYANHKHGAVVVKDGRVVFTGYNKPHSRFDEEDEDEKWAVKHAETEAMQGVEDDSLEGAIIVVCKISETNAPAYSRPCEYCRMVLPAFGIRKVIYSTDYPPYFGEEIFFQ